MSLSKKYYVVSDLDGTLLNKESKLSKATVDFVKKFQEDGNIFVIATGRPFQTSIKFARELGVNILSTYNGTATYYLKDHTSEEYHIKKDLFIEYVKSIRDDLVGACSGDFYNVCIENDKVIPSFCKSVDISRRVYYGRIEEIINHHPLYPCLFIKKESLNRCLLKLKDKKYENIGYRLWPHDELINLELYNIYGTKGEVYTNLMMEENLDPDKGMSFGDEINDIDLIEASLHGVAMKNSTDEVKSKAKYISKYDNDHDGVIKEIIEFMKEH